VLFSAFAQPIADDEHWKDLRNQTQVLLATFAGDLPVVFPGVVNHWRVAV
jgi:hypothetical protein